VLNVTLQDEKLINGVLTDLFHALFRPRRTTRSDAPMCTLDIKLVSLARSVTQLLDSSSGVKDSVSCLEASILDFWNTALCSVMKLDPNEEPQTFTIVLGAVRQSVESVNNRRFILSFCLTLCDLIKPNVERLRETLFVHPSPFNSRGFNEQHNVKDRFVEEFFSPTICLGPIRTGSLTDVPGSTRDQSLGSLGLGNLSVLADLVDILHKCVMQLPPLTQHLPLSFISEDSLSAGLDTDHFKARLLILHRQLQYCCAACLPHFPQLARKLHAISNCGFPAARQMDADVMREMSQYDQYDKCDSL
jgi:hypothetical protein